MPFTDIKALKGMKVVTDDAYDIGTIIDAKCRNNDWKVVGVKISSTTRPREYNSSFKSTIVLETSGTFNYCIKDVFMTRKSFKDTMGRVIPDDSSQLNVSNMIGKKVLTMDGLIIGTVDTVFLDTESWNLVTFSVKLSSEGHAHLGVKKGLILSKKVSGILMSQVGSVTDVMVQLKVNCDTLKSVIVIED